MASVKVCGCCGESVAPLYLREGKEVCLDCLKVYEEGICHRWDQIREISLERKRDRRTGFTHEITQR